MLPYAGTPEFFTQEERRYDVIRGVSQVSSSARHSVTLPQPLEPRPYQRSYGHFANGYSVRRSEQKHPNTACINSYNPPEQTLLLRTGTRPFRGERRLRVLQELLSTPRSAGKLFRR